MRRAGGLTGGDAEGIAIIDTSLARWSMMVKKVGSIAGASLPVFVVAMEANGLAASAQHVDADTNGVLHRALPTSVFDSCMPVWCPWTEAADPRCAWCAVSV